MWEYQTHYIGGGPFNIRHHELAQDKKYLAWLEQMGRDGWELVSASPNVEDGTTRGMTLIFKRPLKQPDPTRW